METVHGGIWHDIVVSYVFELILGEYVMKSGRTGARMVDGIVKD